MIEQHLPDAGVRLAYAVLPQTVPLTQFQVKTPVTPPPQPRLINPDVPTPGSLSMNSTNHPNAWNSAYKFWTSQKYLPKGGRHEGIGELVLQQELYITVSHREPVQDLAGAGGLSVFLD